MPRPPPDGLEKTTVTVGFSLGLQEQTDARLLADEALVTAENCIFDQEGVIKKRWGFLGLPSTTLTLSVYTDLFGAGSVRRIFERKYETCVIDDRSVWSFSNSLSAWKQQDESLRPTVQRYQLMADASVTDIIGDCASASNFILVAYHKDGGIYYSVMETIGEITHTIYSDILVSDEATFPRVVATSSLFYIFYMHPGSAELRCKTVAPALLGTPVGPVSVATTVDTGLGQYDVSIVGSKPCGIWRDSSNNDPTVRIWNATTLATIATRAFADTAAAVAIDGKQTVVAVTWRSAVTNDIRSAVLTDDASLTVLGGPTTTNATALVHTTDNTRTRISIVSEESGKHWVFWEDAIFASGNSAIPFLFHRQINGTAAPQGVDHRTAYAVLAGHPFIPGDGLARGYVPCTTSLIDDPVNPVFAVNAEQLDGVVVLWWDTALGANASSRLVPAAHFAYGESTAVAYPGLSNLSLYTGWVPSFNTGIGTGTYLLAHRVAIEFNRESGLMPGKCGLSVFQVSMSDRKRSLPTEIGDIVVFSGGIPTQYDEQLMVETGYVYNPSIQAAAASTSGSGFLTTLSTYKYKAVFEWYDAKQSRHLSATSTLNANLGAPDSVIPLTGTQNAVTLSIKRMCLTNRMDVGNGSQFKVVVSLYRTLANGDIFYWVASSECTPADTTAWTYQDLRSDIEIQDNEPLYTIGREFDNDPPPPFSAVTTHWGRIFGLSSEKKELHYSKPWIQGRGIQFSRAQVIPLPQGIPVGLASMDGTLVYFSDRGIYALEGEGPSVNGMSADAYRQLVPISSSVGCSDQMSIVASQLGIFFRSSDGIKLLDRTFRLVDEVGYGVAETVALYPRTAGAGLIGVLNAVWFFVDDQEDWAILVYFWDTKKWSVWTGLAGETLPDCGASLRIADAFSGVAAIALGIPAGYVATLNPTTYEDGIDGAGTFYAMDVCTGWLKFGALQNFKRIWRMIALLRRKGAHELRVSVRYNYNEGAFQVLKTWSDAELAALDPEQVRHHLPVQKVQSIQFRFTEVQTGVNGGTTNTQGFELNGIDFEIGMKRGIFKLPAAQSA